MISIQGESGSRGDLGPKGDTGSSGEAGLPGIPGEAGLQGPKVLLPLLDRTVTCSPPPGRERGARAPRSGEPGPRGP